MKAPAMVSGDGSGPVVKAGDVAHPDLEERRREGRLDLVEIEVELVRSDAHDPDVQHEIRIRGRDQRIHEGRLGGQGAGVELAFLEARAADLAFLDFDGSSTVALLELDEEHLAGAILVEGHGFGCPGVGVGHSPGSTGLGGVPVAERQVVELRRGDLVRGDDHFVTIGLARNRDRPVDHPDLPGRGGPVQSGIEALEWAVRRALRGKDAAMDDDVAASDVDRRVVGIEDRDQVVVGAAAREPGQVVGAVDRRLVVDVMGARDDDRADPGSGQPLEFGDDTLHGPARLDV